ncbi:MAG TPA: class I adenylate-forming enzyme family protein [Xanthobacteraceae bacterium]|jgi:acyl-coenzyme A synthetase/AMP-(fatty) acid ligase|nr:class I adenylate-forming enzyme family protein [Xanthobacteraceae bacterium]
MNVVEPILFQCKLNPLATAIYVPGAPIESVSYGQLEKLIHNVAGSVLKAGLAPGQRVGIFVGEPILHAVLVISLMRLGITTLSLRQSAGPKEIPLDAVLTDRSELYNNSTTNVLRIDASWLEGPGHTLDYDGIHTTEENDLCCIILTTGSTGRAKGAAWLHRQFSEVLATQRYSRGPRFAHCSRFLCDLGIPTGPGLRYVLALLGRGATVYFLGPQPADILQIIDLHKIQGMATSPYGLGEFMKFYEADSAFDTNFDHITCQGALLSKELSRRARARMCSNLYIGYGSTETTAVTFGPATLTDTVPGAVGFVLPGIRVEIVDNDGQILPPHQDGIVRIRTRYMASGYANDPESTAEYFRHGCFYSGDIGHVRNDGMLVITGRMKTALNIGGDIINPEIIEEILTSFPGVEDAAVVAVPNELGVNEIQVLFVAKSLVSVPSLRDHCAAKLSLNFVPVRFASVQAIPRGAQGKIERPRLEQYAKTVLATK